MRSRKYPIQVRNYLYSCKGIVSRYVEILGRRDFENVNLINRYVT